MNLSRSLEEFIARYIDSIETLEILVLLQRSPDTFWRPEAIDSHLGLRPGIAEKRLKGLQQNGLLSHGISGGYRYASADESVRQLVDELAREYASRRIIVINTLYSENLGRLRAFADAFKVKNQ